MGFPRRNVPHILSLSLVAAIALVPVGCGGGDGVTKYTVPKTTESGRKDIGDPLPAGGEGRILGAMFPADDPQWFFKLAGPADALTPHEAGFDALLASVSLPANGGPPEFTTPEGWKRGPGRGGIVAATIRTPDGKYEVTVTSSTGGVLGNLKRWATDPNQLGGKSFEADDVPKVTRLIDAKGVKGLRADLRGPKLPKGGPMMGGLPPGHP
jgi:hypothetical protein